MAFLNKLYYFNYYGTPKNYVDTFSPLLNSSQWTGGQEEQEGLEESTRHSWAGQVSSVDKYVHIAPLPSHTVI